MVSPESINLATLPSVALRDRAMLPTTPCIYFAIDSQGVVQYIGKSSNPRVRWQTHHKGVDLALIGGIRIAYLETDADLLPQIERALIAYFRPPFNRLICDEPPTKDKSSVKGVMKVRRTTDVEVPNLGQKIREARKTDPRSLTELAAAAGMTTANWYVIEAEEIKALPVETLRRIEQVLGTSFDVEFDERDHPFVAGGTA